jgi:hypothetical protein
MFNPPVAMIKVVLMGKANNNKSVILHRVTISKKRFDSIPERERLLFIYFGHLTFEINTLLRIFLWSSSFKNLKKEEINARTAQGLVIARVLIGKIYEAYLLIKKHYNREMAKKYAPLLNDTAREALSHFKRYFSNSNLINAVRNKYAFHYSHDELAKILMQIPPMDNLVFYLSQDSRNSFFCSAEKIISNAMLEAIKPGHPNNAQERIEKETIEISKALQIFLQWFMDTIMMKYLGRNLEEIGAIKIRIPNPPKDTEIELPFFISFEESK